MDLNIIGKRLTDASEAKITLVGCNDNTGKEKGNKSLSTQRAEAVRDYLEAIWNIAQERITVEVRNLPAKPSSMKLKEGQAENRRVEIASTLTLRPDVVMPNGIYRLEDKVANKTKILADMAGIIYRR